MARPRHLLLACLVASACERAPEQPKPDAAQPVVQPAPPASPAASDEPLTRLLVPTRRLAAGDLDGDGVQELILVDDQSLRVVDLDGRERARWPVPGGVQVLRAADLDLDGTLEILSGWGQTREHRDASARASILRLDGDAIREELIDSPTSERPEIVDLLPSRTGLLVAHFESKYMVSIRHGQRGADGWSFTPIDTIRMATSLALGDLDGDGREDLILGRVYGDDPEGDGDAFLRREDGTRVPIPVVGGVRSIAVVDLEGDGREQLLIGDGWNRDYGRVARARLTRAWWEAGEFRSELLEDSAGQYTIWDMRVIDLDLDGSPEIVTRGSAAVRVLARVGERWQGRQVGPACEDLLAVELDGTPALLLACKDRSLVRH